MIGGVFGALLGVIWLGLMSCIAAFLVHVASGGLITLFAVAVRRTYRSMHAKPLRALVVFSDG